MSKLSTKASLLRALRIKIERTDRVRVTYFPQYTLDRIAATVRRFGGRVAG